MTAEEIANLYGVRASLVEKEFRQTTRGLKISVQKFCKERLVAEIYAIPEDRYKNGKKKWKRTRGLLNGERAELTDPFTVTMVNDRPYAEARHEAGKPGRRSINPLRESHWRDEMIEAFRPLLVDLCESTMHDILNRRAG